MKNPGYVGRGSWYRLGYLRAPAAVVVRTGAAMRMGTARAGRSSERGNGQKGNEAGNSDLFHGYLMYVLSNCGATLQTPRI